MFSLFTKPLNQLAWADVEELVQAGAMESQEIEFKGDLQVEDGSKHPWHSGARKIDAYARDDLLKEIVAFANADGGNLVLGMAESKDHEKRATKPRPLPRCRELADRLRQLSESWIEPVLPVIEWRGIPESEDRNDGVVIARVPGSRSAPHRLRGTGEFYIRRGENSVPMTIRDIHDGVLRSNSMFDQIERRFETRLLELNELMQQTRSDSRGVWGLRVTVLPTSSPIFFDRPYDDGRLWPPLTQFQCTEPGRDVTLSVGQTGRALGHYSPRPILRGGRRESRLEGVDTVLIQEVHSDGMVEFQLRIDPGQESDGALVYASHILGFTANALKIAHSFRELVGHPSVELAVEVEIRARSGHGRLLWFPDPFGEQNSAFHQNPVRLPRFPVAGPDSFPDVIRRVMNSLRESAGLKAFDDFYIDMDQVPN